MINDSLHNPASAAVQRRKSQTDVEPSHWEHHRGKRAHHSQQQISSSLQLLSSKQCQSPLCRLQSTLCFWALSCQQTLFSLKTQNKEKSIFCYPKEGCMQPSTLPISAALILTASWIMHSSTLGIKPFIQEICPCLLKEPLVNRFWGVEIQAMLPTSLLTKVG